MAATTDRRAATGKSTVYVQDPPIARALFSDVRFAWIWLIVRLFVGYEWITAGIEKFENPAWMQTGTALKGFWTSAIAIPASGKAPITYDWYRSFLTFLLNPGSYSWFAKLVTLGEIAIGLGLIVGAFVGVAAFFGTVMNFNFMLAGSASSNPVLFGLAVFLVLAWKVAGYWGVDRVLLPALGTPWTRGAVFEKEETTSLRPVGQRATDT